MCLDAHEERCHCHPNKTTFGRQLNTPSNVPISVLDCTLWRMNPSYFSWPHGTFRPVKRSATTMETTEGPTLGRSGSDTVLTEDGHYLEYA
ncbi:hypothetical protein QQF64_034585 [Cirrhinus molitorella]|uniref:Uncharacterized protein n=1 Tax=Cirrhinus molitorella TaxID=172907 RepID=A0ABR3L2M1_9TELE